MTVGFFRSSGAAGSRTVPSTQPCFKPSACSILKMLNDNGLHNRYGLAMTVIGDDGSNAVVNYCMYCVTNEGAIYSGISFLTIISFFIFLTSDPVLTLCSFGRRFLIVLFFT